jgi:fibronectin-binding autotransporter adhesin
MSHKYNPLQSVLCIRTLRIGACSLALTTISQAADYTWLGGDGLWNTSNWTDGTNTVVAPSTVGNTAIINSGTVRLSGSDMFGNGGDSTATTAIQVNNGATLDTNNTTNPIVGLTLNGGNLLINGGFSSTWGGVRLSGTLTVGGSAASTISSTGTLTSAWIGVGNNTVKDLTLAVADATGDSNADLTIHSQMIEGNWGGNPHGIIKTGAGTVALHGANTYTGETKIQVGALLLEGTNTGGGLVTVSDDAKLGGNGSTTSAVNVQTGGKLGVDISDWTGSAGSGFTDLQVGALNFAGTWVVDVTSSTAYANFSEASQSFAFLNFTGTPNFNALNVTVEADGFAGEGTWSVRRAGQSLELVYDPSGDSRLATTTELVSSLNPSLDDDSVTFTATIKEGASVATDAGDYGGTVEFRVNGNLVPTGSFINGVATFTTNTLPLGQSLITADYTGDLTNYRSSSDSLTQTNGSPGILTFNFGSHGPAAINGLSITKTVPYLTDPATLPAATYTLTDGATCTPASGVVQDFSSPVEFTVKSADESITKVYTVTVTVAPPPTYTWQGGVGNWNSVNWLLNDGSEDLVAGPTGSSNARMAIINSGQVNLQGNDIFGGGGTADSPYITVNNATLASANTVNQFQRLTLNNGVYLCNGGANAQYPAAYFARTLTATGSSFVNVGTGNNNMINLGVGGTVGSAHYHLTIDTPSSSDSLTFNAVLQTFTGGQLIKTGSGTLKLNAANTYNGATNVNVGTLLLNGTNTGGGTLTVAENARLGGSGSTTSAVILEDGGKLIANITDWSAGTGDNLTVGSLSLGGAWSLDVMIDAFTENDKVVQFLTTGGISGFVAPTSVNGPGEGTWSVRRNTLDSNILELVYTASTVIGDPYDEWAGENGYNLVGGREDDDDGDGLSNFHEFAFGLDPTSGASVNPIVDTSELKDGYFKYTRLQNSGLTYTVWTSPDLENWTDVSDTIAEESIPDNGIETVTVDLGAAPDGDTFFVRVSAE